MGNNIMGALTAYGLSTGLATLTTYGTSILLHSGNLIAQGKFHQVSLLDGDAIIMAGYAFGIAGGAHVIIYTVAGLSSQLNKKTSFNFTIPKVRKSEPKKMITGNPEEIANSLIPVTYGGGKQTFLHTISPSPLKLQGVGLNPIKDFRFNSYDTGNKRQIPSKVMWQFLRVAEQITRDSGTEWAYGKGLSENYWRSEKAKTDHADWGWEARYYPTIINVIRRTEEKSDITLIETHKNNWMRLALSASETYLLILAHSLDGQQAKDVEKIMSKMRRRLDSKS